MFGGNPNVTILPYQPVDHRKSPWAQPTRNPYGYGIQRTLGQMAFQPNRYGLGRGTNTTPQIPERLRRLAY